MNLINARTEFQHSFFPKFIFQNSKNTEKFINNLLLQGSNPLYDLACDFANNTKTKQPFSNNDYSLELIVVTLKNKKYIIKYLYEEQNKDDKLCLVISFPQGNYHILCPRIYLFLDLNLRCIRYITIENDETSNYYFLCEIEKNSNHIIYGYLKPDLEIEKNAVLSIINNEKPNLGDQNGRKEFENC